MYYEVLGHKSKLRAFVKHAQDSKAAQFTNECVNLLFEKL